MWFLIISAFVATSSAQFTCECGIFISEQFSGGGGQSQPLPLEYIGVGDDGSIPDTECQSDPAIPGPCDQFCLTTSINWAANNSVCDERPNNALRCYGSVWCEDLSYQERVPDQFTCAALFAYSRIAQCIVGDPRYGWIDIGYAFPDQYIGCNGINFVPCEAFPCTCSDDVTNCSPAGCKAYDHMKQYHSDN